MTSLVQDGLTGLLFEPGDEHDLAAKLAWAQANPQAMRQMGENARRHYEAELTGAANHEQLLAIYAEARAAAK